MKKLILLILSISLCLVFTNCEENKIEKYESFIVDSANNEYGAPSEFSSQNVYFTKKNMPAKSCTFQGVTYSGEYQNSIQNKGDSFVTDYYGEPSSVQFGLKEGTNELVYIDLLTLKDLETLPTLEDVADPENTALNIATEIAKEYINISEYTQQITKLNSFIDGLDNYNVYFERIINGYHSSDYISITVTSKGTHPCVTIGDINAFKEATVEFDPLEIERSLNEKIVNTYLERNIDAKLEEISKQMLILTANGDICMYSEVAVRIRVEGDTEEYTTLLAIITGL